LSFCCLASNIDFDDKTYSEKTPCTIKGEAYMERAAKCLDIDLAKFKETLLIKILKIGKDTTRSPNTK